MKKIIPLLAAVLLLGSCVSKKAFKNSQKETAALRQDSTRLAREVSTLKSTNADLTKKIETLNSQNAQLGQFSAEQQSQLSESQLALQKQQQRTQQLQAVLAQQKAQSEQLKNKMSEALKGFSSSDLTVNQKNGKVYVSLSENLLFPSGSAVINAKGADALSKLAAVLNLNPDVAVNIEGHTDSIPIKGKYKDNWDLSTARANAIVRILVENYKVDPLRVVASGHSLYDPVDSNSTAQGRAKNRRSEIVLTPKLEEMYKLLE